MNVRIYAILTPFSNIAIQYDTEFNSEFTRSKQNNIYYANFNYKPLQLWRELYINYMNASIYYSS